ncbi:T9SS type A sorting domain-containing protein [Vaginella massiliensis]|uniref:T9SS type A sorting domain-containing protein n=1 Tax=Vaginella massiliensis TaxID=1816680 RepID=UPI0008386042|nr:T9SS type A sorting domain-containing protein [Vaginella massiliensis]
MKKHLYSLAFLLSSLAMGQIHIGNDTYSSNLPISVFYNYTYSQSIYKATAIGTAGNINAIEYTMKAGSNLNNSDLVDVYLSHKKDDEFLSTTDWSPYSELTKVYSGNLVLGSDNKVKIVFDQEFAYNGVDNLVVTVHEKKTGYGSFSSAFIGTMASSNSSLYRRELSDSSVIDPANLGTGILYNILPNITIYGLERENSVPSCTKAVLPADGATNQIFLPKIVYDAAAGAEKYLVSVGDEEGNWNIANRVDNEDYLDFFFVYELKPNTKHYVQITPVNAVGEAENCPITTFTTAMPVENDNCSTAEVVGGLPYAKDIDGSFASNSEGPVECDGVGVANDGLWYVVEGNGGDITIKVTPTSFWDPHIVVKEGSCQENLCVANVNDHSFSQAETATLYNTVEGKKYYINIGATSIIDFTAGKFNLEITTNKTMGVYDVHLNKTKVYPNPTKDFLTIENAENFVAYELIDAIGRSVRSQQLVGKQIDVQNLSNGVYILKLITKDRKEIVQKIVKK